MPAAVSALPIPYRKVEVMSVVSILESAMPTLVIRDLTENSELDRKAMEAVRGGMSFTGRATPAGVIPIHLAPTFFGNGGGNVNNGGGGNNSSGS
jgi:hypothetical protein